MAVKRRYSTSSSVLKVCGHECAECLSAAKEEMQHRGDEIAVAKGKIHPRSYYILHKRYVERETLYSIGVEYKITRERVRQLINLGLIEIKNAGLTELREKILAFVSPAALPDTPETAERLQREHSLKNMAKRRAKSLELAQDEQPALRLCVYCQRPFRDKLFSSCSPECREKYNQMISDIKRKRKENLEKVVKCVVCEGEFKRSNVKELTCSFECQQARYNSQVRIHNRKRLTNDPMQVADNESTDTTEE